MSTVYFEFKTFILHIVNTNLGDIIACSFKKVGCCIDMFCLFIYFESHEQFFSYLATDTIAGDRAANLDLCLALPAFSSEGSFTCHTHCDTGPPFLRSYPKDP
jgi:hypothetical protein